MRCSNQDNKQVWTLIIKLSSGEYYVCKSTNPMSAIEELKQKHKVGYLFNKKNIGDHEIVFAVKGDYKNRLKAFGGKLFMEMTKAYNAWDELSIKIFQ